MARATTTRRPEKQPRPKEISGEKSSANHPAHWAGGGSVEALGHAASEVGLAAGDDGGAHGFGHEDGILGFGDGGVHQDSIGAKLHGDGGIRSGAHSGIHDHGNFGDAFAENAEVGGILHAEAGADGRGQRHDGGGTGVNEFAGGDEVVVGVRENDEAFLTEDARGFDELLGVGKKSLLVADDFKLDPVRKTDFAGQASGSNGFVGGVESRSVRQDKYFFAINVIQQ